MITFKDLYSVLCAVVPLYVTMFLAYVSVKWWKIFTPDQCSGINKFVAIFAVPLLSFDFISRINPYKMNLLFIAADSASKVIILVLLFAWAKLSKRGSLDWAITLFSLSTLPNTLVMGIPLLKSMYGDDTEYLMIQAVVLQCIIWYTLLLFLFEYREARGLVMKKLNGNHQDSNSIGEIDVEEGEVNKPTQNLNKVAMVERTVEEDGKELHLFVWQCGCCSTLGVCKKSVQACNKEEDTNTTRMIEEDKKLEPVEVLDDSPSMSLGMITVILKMVWFKLIRNPNSYASLLGFSWALASCRWNIEHPEILQNSVRILSNAGLGMAMFSLGLFMALQPKIIACGNKLAAYGMFVRFVVGPAVIAVASIGVGLRGEILKISIVQAALPQGIVPFVFAREYDLHPDVLSTAVIFGMIVSLPITTLYYVFLGL